MSHGTNGMGYPKNVFVPWDGMIVKIFRPMGHIPTNLRPMGPMGWDGTGPSRPTRSSDLNVILLVIINNI